MTRHYPLAAPCPGVFVFEDDSAALEAAGDVRDAFEARNIHAFATWVGNCVVLPRPFEARRSAVGRTLRDDEYEEYASACRDIATFIAPTSVRTRFEMMYVFDWGRFTPEQKRALAALYPTLPGSLGNGSEPAWFGRDETVGPFVWASFEPPGLQIAALIEQATFEDWLARFDAGTRTLPVRDLY